MDITDIIDIAGDLMPPAMRRAVSLVLIVGCLFWAPEMGRLISWYAEHKAQQLTRQLQPIVERSMRTPTPVVSSTSVPHG